MKYSINGQAMPDKSIPFGKEAYAATQSTSLRWLGGAGVFINSRGTILVTDPVLGGFDMQPLFEAPLDPENAPRPDAVLITHIDNDHYSPETCKRFGAVCHTTQYVAEMMHEVGINGTGHDIGGSFDINGIEIRLTPALHNWQNGIPVFSYRHWETDESCGFFIKTPDGNIWMPGDSRLLEAHLNLKEKPDVILFDFSDDSWHIGFENAVRLANAYPEAQLICIHWGTYDAPDFAPFNADPSKLTGSVTNPSRIHALDPGEEYILRR